MGRDGCSFEYIRAVSKTFFIPCIFASDIPPGFAWDTTAEKQAIGLLSNLFLGVSSPQLAAKE